MYVHGTGGTGTDTHTYVLCHAHTYILCHAHMYTCKITHMRMHTHTNWCSEHPITKQAFLLIQPIISFNPRRLAPGQTQELPETVLQGTAEAAGTAEDGEDEEASSREEGDVVTVAATAGTNRPRLCEWQVASVNRLGVVLCLMSCTYGLQCTVLKD